MSMTEHDFRRLVLAYYHRLRKGGLTRLGAREFVGELVNAAYSLELFEFQRELQDLERIRWIARLMGSQLGSDDDYLRLAAKAGLPWILEVLDNRETAAFHRSLPYSR